MPHKIFFKEDTYPIVTQILADNNLEETDEEVLEKMENDGHLLGEAIAMAIDKILLEKKSEEDICTFLGTELKIDAQKAKSLYSGIYSKLIPIAEIVEIEDRPAEPAKGEEIEPEAEAPKEPQTPVAPPPPQTSGPDVYREPIE